MLVIVDDNANTIPLSDKNPKQTPVEHVNRQVPNNEAA
jgi:hypothetical protein